MLAALLGLAANAATSDARWPGPLDYLRSDPWPWVATLAVLSVATIIATVRMQDNHPADANDPPLPPPVTVPPWFVERAQTREAVAEVCRGGHAVAITTSLSGAGGFGKSMLAMAVCAQPRVRRHFRSRVYVVTIGRDVRGRPAIAAKVAEMTRFITGDTLEFTDPQLAGKHLGRLLDDRPRTLLVLDDVWEEEQLRPFLQGGNRCVRLVTTRNPHLIPGGGRQIRVDEMSEVQASAVLQWDLPALPASLIADLLQVTGYWALLLRLTNRLIAEQVATGARPATAAARALTRLRENGPRAIDPSGRWNMDDPESRNQAARASIEAATTLLPPGGDLLFAELAVFAEDESIPVSLVATLWHTTSGLDEDQTRLLCRELQHLSLISLTDRHGGRISLHDVIRDGLKGQLEQRGISLSELNQQLINAMSSSLPEVPPLDWREPGPVRAWWDTDEGYVLDHLIEHLMAAGHSRQAFTVASDLRWIEARLIGRGPTAPVNDLSRIGTPAARDLANSIARRAHLLTPTDPAHAVIGVLHNVLQDTPRWQSQMPGRRQDPALRPLLIRRWLEEGFHTPYDHAGGRMTSIAISPDGTWLASGGYDNTVRFRYAANGTLRPTMRIRAAPGTGHIGRIGVVRDVAFAPSGVWLATAGDGVRIWNLSSQACTGIIGRETPFDFPGPYDGGHRGDVRCVAIAADGTWLASGGEDQTVRLADPITHAVTAVLRGHTASVRSVAIAMDRTWLASGSDDHPVRLWDTATRSCLAVLQGHTDSVTSVAIAPDGSWLASAGDDYRIRIWDRRSGRCTAVLEGHSRAVRSVAVTLDGGWLASAGDDNSVRIWRVASLRTLAVMRSNWPLHTCAWSRSGAVLAVGGTLGLHVFDFRP
ncbi:NB-ARC domain-containing protein [Streptomyces mirabilis]|uniref:NB-ARC domain-containing protein n=1 Tax=Streptomyces mirabilis TaxID=68239 RepID=UPI002E29763C|nr:NB-ARC domain-containing protein [Streptomyces mirabilis]